MASNRSKREQGQAIVLIVFAIIGLLAFTALVVDGGSAYSDRRYDQNTADASALAGAGVIAQKMNDPSNPIMSENFNCNWFGAWYSGIGIQLDARNAAVNRASVNHFTIDAVTSDVPGIKVTCSTGANSIGTLGHVDVQVIITNTVQTAFAQLIFGGALTNTVTSIVEVDPGSTLTMGNGIVSFSPYCAKPSSNNYTSADGGIIFDGNNSTTVNNGGIYSRSCLYPNGQPSVTVNNGAIVAQQDPINSAIVWEDGSTKGTTNFSPSPAIAPYKLQPWIMPAPPQCTDPNYPTRNAPNNGGTIDPGKYIASGQGNQDAIKVKNGDTIKMKPGIYCIDGNITIAGTLEVDGYSPSINLSGDHDGVTIYMRTGSFNSQGGGYVYIWARTANYTAVSCTYNSGTKNCDAKPGLLFYMPPNPDNVYPPREAATFSEMINMSGNAGNIYSGTVYAPYSYINFGGNPFAGSGVSTELVGYVIRLDGTATIDINYDGSRQFHTSASISQKK